MPPNLPQKNSAHQLAALHSGLRYAGVGAVIVCVLTVLIYPNFSFSLLSLALPGQFLMEEMFQLSPQNTGDLESYIVSVRLGAWLDTVLYAFIFWNVGVFMAELRQNEKN